VKHAVNKRNLIVNPTNNAQVVKVTLNSPSDASSFVHLWNMHKPQQYYPIVARFAQENY
jgi:hypothetical protein